MMHRVLGQRLKRDSDHRDALLRNLAGSLVQYGKIESTETKIKFVKPFIEKLVTRAKKADFNAVKYIKGVLPTTEQGKKLFSEVVPRFLETPGGYTRIVKLGRRVGDSAPMARLEWSKEIEVVKKAEKKDE